MNNLAPIGLSVYGRLSHLKETVEALKENKLARDSELYIFSDAPKLGDEKKVQAVRDYLKTIDGFKRVHVYERKENNRVANNRGGMDMLLTEHDYIIFLEEDVVTAPGFLEFMNKALSDYKDDESVFSISAYCPPIKIPDYYNYDVFVLPRFCAWGVGMYKRTFQVLSQPIDKHEFDTLKNKKVLTVGGGDILHMVRLEVEGKLDAGDVRCMYYQALHSKYTIYPKKSLVQNIGHDGSGVHCGKSKKFSHDDLWDKTKDFVFVKGIAPDTKIMAENKKFRKVGLKAKFIYTLKGTFFLSILTTIKRLWFFKER